MYFRVGDTQLAHQQRGFSSIHQAVGQIFQHTNTRTHPTALDFILNTFSHFSCSPLCTHVWWPPARLGYHPSGVIHLSFGNSLLFHLAWNLPPRLGQLGSPRDTPLSRPAARGTGGQHYAVLTRVQGRKHRSLYLHSKIYTDSHFQVPRGHFNIFPSSIFSVTSFEHHDHL